MQYGQTANVANGGEQPPPNANSHHGNLRTIADLPPLLLRAPQAASFCSIAIRTWRMLDANGRIPRSIHLGRSAFWRRKELQDWVDAGCPDRVTWDAMQQL
jgi:predicted DNA-binding transcriptional regulator AlpA